MANAALATPTVVKTWGDSALHVIGTIAIDASPLEYRTGGVVLSFFQDLIKASRAPIWVNIRGIAGYIYSYVAGADASLGKVLIQAQTNAAAAGDPLAELANTTAIPAAISGDTITFYAIFKGPE